MLAAEDTVVELGDRLRVVVPRASCVGGKLPGRL